VAFKWQLWREAAQFDIDLSVAQDGSGQEHALADEIGDKSVGRAVVEVVRRVPLLDPAVGHQADFVCHGECFVLVVRDEDGGHALFFQNAAHLERQAFAQLDVEVGERFVEQQQFRMRGQGACQGYALLLPAGQFVGVLALLSGQSDSGQQFPHTLGNPLLGQ